MRNNGSNMEYNYNNPTAKTDMSEEVKRVGGGGQRAVEKVAWWWWGGRTTLGDESIPHSGSANRGMA